MKKGDIVICLASATNNSEMIKGEQYIVDKVEQYRDKVMIKLQGHPDWWSAERFKIKQP